MRVERLPDNSLFCKVKQNNSSFQSCQENVWIFGKAYVTDWLRYLDFCMPVKKGVECYVLVKSC